MRVAAIDLGSNSFHLLVVDASADGHFVPLARDKEVLRLGDMVTREGRITEPGLVKVIATIQRFKSQADSLGVTELMASATSAIRAARWPAGVVHRRSQRSRARRSRARRWGTGSGRLAGNLPPPRPSQQPLRPTA